MKRYLAIFARIALVIVILLLCAWFSLTMHWINLPMICHEGDTVNVPDFSGKLLFVRDVSPEERIIYELTSGMNKPRELYHLPITEHKSKRINSQVVSPDRRYVFDLDLGVLVDLNSGSYTLVPASSAEKGIVQEWEFSPDGEYSAYIFWPNPHSDSSPQSVFVYNMTTGETSEIYTAPCAYYLGGGNICGQVFIGGWIDADHLLFSHTFSLPLSLDKTTSYEPVADTWTITTKDGTTIQSYTTRAQFLGVAGSEIIAFDSDSQEKWMDIAKLLSGEFVMNALPSSVQPNLYSFILSAQYKLDYKPSPWGLTEVPTGTTQRLGTTRIWPI